MSIEVTVEYAHREWDSYDHVVHIRNYQQLQAKVAELEEENARLKVELAKCRDAPVVAWVEVIDSYEGPYHFHGQKLLGVGKHKLIVKPGEQ